MKPTTKRLAILAAGGPAPGINSVISAATIRARLEGVEVIGALDGFKWLMQGNTKHIQELDIENVSRIHFLGGSTIGIARDNPTYSQENLENTVTSLLRLDVDKLITIGGDGTAFSAMQVEKVADGRISVVHVPKTIDNDLDLPHGISTFGYQTARHLGVEIVKSLMMDAHTTTRWYFVVSMGRKAGHLALGIGNGAGATLTLIPEEFAKPPIRLAHIVDILTGAIIKRNSQDRQDGVAVIAEGLVELLHKDDQEKYMKVKRDSHGNIVLGQINFGEILKDMVAERLKALGLETTIVAKNIGYELRCADPIPFDIEYARNLGYCAAEYILDGGNGAMVSIQEGHFVPLRFDEIIDSKTNRTKMRLIDIFSESYHIARRYMLRMNRQDFADSHAMAKYAAICGLSPAEFQKQFAYLIKNDRFYKKMPVELFKGNFESSNGKKKKEK